MTTPGNSVDPVLLDALGVLGVSAEVPPSPQNWAACLLTASELLRLREEETAARSRRMVTRLSDQARSAERVFEAFLTTMSHELRTPMAVILGSLELIGGSAGECDVRDTVEAARRAALDLTRTIDGILDYCRLEAGELGLIRRPFDVRQVVADSLERHRPAADARGLRLESWCESNLPLVVGDSRRIEQVLDALLDNAIKFTKQGFVRVAARAEKRSPETIHLRCSVTDSGAGITRAGLEQVFAPFQQLDATPSRRAGGIGLGLALAEKLVAAMEGRLEVFSTPGRGSDFSFTLNVPIVRAQQIGAQRHPRPARHTPPRVLLAEDNEFNRLFVIKSLESLGCMVRAVPDGKAALAVLSGFDPDLVLMDVQMPEMDGWAAARQVRALPEPFRSVPIIALTANALPSDRVRCEEAGMDELLAKPMSVEALRSMVAHWLQLEGNGDRISSLTGSDVGDLLSSAGSVLDVQRIEALVRQAGSAAIVRELSVIFVDDVEARLQGLFQAWRTGDMQEVQRLAHAVKGSAANFGAFEMARLAERLERAPRECVQDDLKKLQRAFQDVRRVLRKAVLDEKRGLVTHR